MKKNIYAIYGASGFGKEVLPLLRNHLTQNEEIYFVDDNDVLESLNGVKVLSLDEFMHIDSDNYFITIAISNSQIRQKLTQRCTNRNIQIFDIKADNALMLDKISIGEGSIICPFVTLTSTITIGKSFHANLYSYVAHDCTIGDYVTFAPAVKCNGNIVIEDHVYVGTGAIIKQGKPGRPLVIGKGAIVGAGAVVTKNVPAGMTVFGNPAIELTKENLKRRS